MKGPFRRSIIFPPGLPPSAILTREWLLTNGRGGYASSTLGNVPTRRYHGLLVASLETPLGRTVMLGNLWERLHLEDGTEVDIGGFEWIGKPEGTGMGVPPNHFELVAGMPSWRYQVGDITLEKELVLVHARNTVHVIYRVKGGSARLCIFPGLCFRPHESRLERGPRPDESYVFSSVGAHYEVTTHAAYPPLRMAIHSPRAHSFSVEARDLVGVLLRVERSRGYDHATWEHSPGCFTADLREGEEIAFTGSTESWTSMEALSPLEARAAERMRRERLIVNSGAADATTASLVIAADQFIIKPTSRMVDTERALAMGDEVRTIIAGYHWFTDWGRDTMISLPGLALATGRKREAGYILRTFGKYVRDGLIPNMFPEGQAAGLYHTADATLWFFQAIHCYLRATNDRMTLEILLPVLQDIIALHVRGTRFGIKVDPADGLLSQGEEGYQLTWMDAKVHGWVVTPRRGKAVEINALYYNALMLTAEWVAEHDGDTAAAPLRAAAEKARASFNQRFWYPEGGHLYDVVDGPDGKDDPALRPNQLFAISLAHPVLDPSKWKPVVDVVERELLTPVGLRSLSRTHPDYKPRYDGDLKSRDAAYHQGTVWSWLIGPFVDAWRRANVGREAEALRFIAGLTAHTQEACIGSISEIFDAEPPYCARGCVAQAWGVAEVLRLLTELRASSR